MTQEPDKSRNDPDQTPAAANARTPDSRAGAKLVRCEDIQAALLEYLQGELGPAAADLAREHLRKCPDCQAAAAEMRETLDLLRAASTPPAPTRLSDESRKRMLRAVTHPVLDWIERHRLTTMALFVGLMILCVWGFMKTRGFARDESLRTYPVTIGVTNVGRNPNVEPPPLKLKDPETERRLLEETNQSK